MKNIFVIIFTLVMCYMRQFADTQFMKLKKHVACQVFGCYKFTFIFTTKLKTYEECHTKQALRCKAMVKGQVKITIVILCNRPDAFCP